MSNIIWPALNILLSTLSIRVAAKALVIESGSWHRCFAGAVILSLVFAGVMNFMGGGLEALLATLGIGAIALAVLLDTSFPRAGAIALFSLIVFVSTAMLAAKLSLM